MSIRSVNPKGRPARHSPPLKNPATSISWPPRFAAGTGPGVNQIGLSRGHIVWAIDASLGRLGLDYVDLYQIHGADLNTPLEETVRALDDVIVSGKARYVGFCNLPAWMAMKALSMADNLGCSRFVSAQMYYSIAGRDIEREIVPLARQEQLAILPWSPLAGGLLSGKFDLENPGPPNARRSSFDFPPVDKTRAKAVLAAMRSVAEAHNISVARVALAWILTRQFVTSIIIGAKTTEQLADNLAATDVALDPQQVAAIDEASALPPEYPGWMMHWQDRDRRPPETKPAS